MCLSPGTRLKTLKYKDLFNKHATFYPFTIHYVTTQGQKRAYLRLRPNIFDTYLRAKATSDIILWDPTVAGASFVQYGDVNEDDAPPRTVWLAPAVIRRSSKTSPNPEQEFRVCLFERKTLEAVHVGDRTGLSALWGMPYGRVRELAQLAEQGDATITRAALARVFLRSSLWHDAVLAWDTEAQEQFDKFPISRMQPPHLCFLLANVARCAPLQHGTPGAVRDAGLAAVTAIPRPYAYSNTQKRAILLLRTTMNRIRPQLLQVRQLLALSRPGMPVICVVTLLSYLISGLRHSRDISIGINTSECSSLVGLARLALSY